MLDQVLVSADDPITAASIAELLGLADEELVAGFIDALLTGDVLAGIAILDRLEAEGRDLVAFSEQLVTHLRASLVERMSQGTDAQHAPAHQLAVAARRLTGIDASRSGLGGFRWQLELCLLAAADTADAPVASTAPPAPAVPVAAARPRTTKPETHPERVAVTTPRSEPVRAEPAATPEVASTAAPSASPSGVPAGAGAAAVPPAVESAPADPDDAISAVRAAWPRIVAVIGGNPANRPLVATCRPVEVKDGMLVLGFPEDQAFMRDIADRKRRVLEDGIASVIGRSVAVRCVVTNLELVEPVDSGEGDLVTQARRIFEGELAGVEDID
jgi:hypothetical protein